jgi:cytochrome c oxidase subunit 2
MILMAEQKPKNTQRILIASTHSLFAQGLRSLLENREGANVEIVGMVGSVQEAIEALDSLTPDLIIVDYDDENLNRDEFLAKFVESDKKLRVVLLSLDEANEALVYDRRTLAASEVGDWLDEWTKTPRVDEIKQDITGVRKNADNRRVDMKHLIVAGILVAVVTALLIVGMGQVRLLPVAASAQAAPIDFMFRLEFMVIAFLFALIVVMMVYSIIVFRRKPGDTTDAKHIEGNMNLEVAWTIVPLFVVVYFAYLGGQTLGETQRADPQPLEVNVIGSQWSWRFEYPELGITSPDLYLPVNKQALLHISSTDVIHSFWVPEFRLKQDALPGGENFVRDLRVTPTMVGEFKVRCAELCGLQHANMRAPVIVSSEEDFNAWVLEQTGVSDDPVERGREWYQNFGCAACHTLDGTTGVGPTWQGLYGSQVTFDDGTTTTADDDYLYNSIRNPGSEIVEGYQNLMPANIAESMTDDQVDDVIRFIESLK